MPTNDVYTEMRLAAAYAIRMARERFGKQLDYSESSLPTLELIVDQAYQQYKTGILDGGELSDAEREYTAAVWGSYYGELIRLKFGGVWIIEDSKRLLVIDGQKFFPIDHIYQRITGHLQEDVKQYFNKVLEKLSLQSKNLEQPKPISSNGTYPSDQSQLQPRKAIVQPQKVSNKKNNVFSVERILQIVLGAAVMFFIVGATLWFYKNHLPGPINPTSPPLQDPIPQNVSGDCSEASKQVWIDATLNRQNQLNNDLDEILILWQSQPRNSSDYVNYALRAEKRYQDQKIQSTPHCIVTFGTLALNGFYYNWKFLNSARNGEWSEAAAYSDIASEKMHEAELESARLDVLGYVADLDRLTNSTSTPGPTLTKIPISIKLITNDIGRNWVREQDEAITLVDAYLSDQIDGYRPSGIQNGGYEHGFTLFLVVKIKYENLSNHSNEFGAGLFELASYKDDGAFEYYAERNSDEVVNIYPGENLTSVIGFEIKPESTNLQLCFGGSGTISGNGKMNIYTKCDNNLMPFEFKLIE